MTFLNATINLKGGSMSKTTPVYARIDTELKENAEKILKKLGVSPSNLIQMLYSQVILQNGIPFNVTLNQKKPIAIKNLTKEEFDYEIQKGISSLNQGFFYTAEEVDNLFKNYDRIYLGILI